MLRDTYEVVALKARLDHNRAQPGDHADPRVVGRVARSTPEQAAAALAAAREAQPVWARVGLERRLDFARAFHCLLRERTEELLDILIAEGTPLPVGRWALSAALNATHPDSLAYARSVMVRESRQAGRLVRLLRKPDGVVCLDPARNAPMLTALSGVPTLAAGNALVVNVPPTVPLSVAYAFHELVAPLLADHGAPPGTLSVLCAPARPMLRTWLASPHCDDIFFFGGSAQGGELTRSCLEHGKKPIMELAGNDALVVWRDADLAGAVQAALERYLGSGQLCLAPKFALVHPDVADEFTRRLHQEVMALRVGPPEDPDVVLTPVIKRNQCKDVLDDAVARGAELLCGGDMVDVDGRPSLRGPFIQPALLRVQGLERASTMSAVTEETFFPLMCVVVPEATTSVADSDEALLDSVLAFVNANRYGLRNSLWCRAPHVIHRFTDEVTNGGTLKVNDSHIGTLPVLPTVGGTGLSGGVFGEANIPFLRTTRLQGISLGTDVAEPFDHLATTGTVAKPGMQRSTSLSPAGSLRH
ncbi:aldehyde dehydrogenase [Streptomyces sp. SH5]|uniref:aldehyde dehydrogenase family protein n=1 Tax=Streptomyces sp. SH5 TaxID=3041765 RepID=UPI002477ED41|nr:aldehyde dehydrogenase [Streptomyces sp. SH5]WGP08201.1 aldehyde dehydrogenase [Streptomyces sp. SH5]